MTNPGGGGLNVFINIKTNPVGRTAWSTCQTTSAQANVPIQAGCQGHPNSG